MVVKCNVGFTDARTQPRQSVELEFGWLIIAVSSAQANSVTDPLRATLRLQRDGPIRRSHGTTVMKDFLDVDFAEMGGYFRIEFRDVSRASVAHLEGKMERLVQELHELAELDSYLPPDQRQTIGLALGMWPWMMSWVTGLKKKPGANKRATAKN